MQNTSRCPRARPARSTPRTRPGGRVIAVGTTVVISLETAAAARPADTAAPAAGRRLQPYKGATRLFIKPGDKFRIVDAMVTNFIWPESTLLMLCAAFVGRETLLAAYAHAIAARYRFFSYGDAMVPHARWGPR